MFVYVVFVFIRPPCGSKVSNDISVANNGAAEVDASALIVARVVFEGFRRRRLDVAFEGFRRRRLDVKHALPVYSYTFSISYRSSLRCESRFPMDLPDFAPPNVARRIDDDRLRRSISSELLFISKYI